MRLFVRSAVFATTLPLLPFSLSAQAAPIKFPDGFKWCVSTAAHQIEGGNENSDFWKWETEQKDRVITRVVVPGVIPAPPSGSGAFSMVGEPCPIRSVEEAQAIDPSIDWDNSPGADNGKTILHGDHTVKFPQGNGQVAVCEYSGRAVDHWNEVEQAAATDEKIKNGTPLSEEDQHAQQYQYNDVAAIQNLNVQQYRFSIEWAKVQPREAGLRTDGTLDDGFDEAAIAHYAREIKLLTDRHIEPLVTLFHFTMPQWLRASGGWENPHAAQYFAEFTRRVYTTPGIGDHVTTWFTLNEPMVHVSAGYVAGVLPPGKKLDGGYKGMLAHILDLKNVLVGMLSAHAAAYHMLHDLAAKVPGRTVRVGVAQHLRIFDPLQPTISKWGFVAPGPDAFLADTVATMWNWMLIDAIETGTLGLAGTPLSVQIPNLYQTEDFSGMNYYTRDILSVNSPAPMVDADAKAHGRINDMGWEIYPKGFERILRELDERVMHPFGDKLKTGRHLKIFVSENGIADWNDGKRQQFLEDHFAAMYRAMTTPDPDTHAPPVELEGYCHWSLTDNFEWNSGYYPQFGFYSVVTDHSSKDYLQRGLRKSGEWFAKLAHDNQFTPTQPGSPGSF